MPAPPARALISSCLLSLSLLVLASTPCVGAVSEDRGDQPLQVIGATAWVEEASTGVRFKARVDTGAASCSLHAEEIEVPNGKKKMRSNIGKKVRFRILNAAGKSHWVESTIQSTVIVKNAEERERRYKVWVDLLSNGVKKRVCATLNDRSEMEFPVLIGRNFLKGDFLVDVSREASTE